MEQHDYDERRRGLKQTVIFSHGMLMDQRMFGPQLEALTSHHAVAYNHRARTGRGEEPYSLYDLAGDCLALIDRLHVERCVLVGMSMGGFMALRFALSYPERARGLVLIGASALPYGSPERDRWEQHFGAHRDETPLARSFARSEALGHFSRRARRKRPELIEAWTARFGERTGSQTWFETLSWSRQDDIRPRLGEVRCPVLIVHGDEDEAVALDDALETQRLLPAARLLVVPFAGHAVNLESPEIVNDGLRAFLEELDSRPAATNSKGE